jgi:hypothetical protein
LEQLLKRLHSRIKGTDPGLILVLLICLIAIWPFLSRPGLPHETDAELHIYRLAELSRLVRGGEFYPRWAPNFYFGYGYPIFNYYAPLSYYLALPFELLPGVDPVAAIKAVFVGTLLGAALGMYGFMRDNWGRAAGYVAAAAFVYAPYIQYVDPHARGDVAESVSFGVFALALWAVDRLRRSPSAANWVASVLLVAGLVLSHNLMAMVFFAFLLAWALWQIIAARVGGDGTEGTQWHTLPALFLGVGLAAFFWLPVALEQDAVNLSTLIGDGGHFDFRNHFLSISRLFGATALLDWGATESAFTLNLGIAQWLLALVGGTAVLVGKARWRSRGLFFVVAALVLLFLMLPLSIPVWETIPLLPYMQFPWRLLGAMAAVLAVLSGIGINALANFRVANGRGTGGATSTQENRPWLPALAIAIILFLALPLAEVAPWAPEPWNTSARAVSEIERRGRWLGTTSTADFVPATVDTIPRPADQLLADFAAERPLDRVNRASLPEGVTVETERVSPLHTRYRVRSDNPFLLRLFQFDFPGWVARIDGEKVESELGRPEGFLVVPVPEGEHVVEVEFMETAERRAAWLVSGLSLLLMSLGANLVFRVANGGGYAEPARAVAYAGQLSRRMALYVAGVVFVAFVSYLILSPLELLRYQSTGNVAEPAENDTYAQFGGQLALIGYTAPAEVRAGETVEVTLFWKAQQSMDINFQVFLHLTRSDGRIVAQSDKLNPGDFPTRRWPVNKYVRDVHRLVIPADTEPGTYTLSTGMWVQAEGWRLPLVDENGEQIGDHYDIQSMQVFE